MKFKKHLMFRDLYYREFKMKLRHKIISLLTKEDEKHNLKKAVDLNLNYFYKKQVENYDLEVNEDLNDNIKSLLILGAMFKTEKWKWKN